MSTQVDWSRELDAAIPRGPDRAPDAYRTAGRSAVRRRRAGAVALTLAATVVAGAGVWAATPGPSSSLPATPAATEGSTPSPTPDTDRPDPSESPTADPRPEGISSPPRTATRDEISLLGSGPHMLDADYTPDGDLVVRPGWTVATFENNRWGPSRLRRRPGWS